MMKKKKINQIVLYYYIASFCVFLIVLFVLTYYFSAQQKKEEAALLHSYVTSTQNRITVTVDSMTYMQKIIYFNSLSVLMDNGEPAKFEILSNLFKYKSVNGEFFYSILFDNDENSTAITSDVSDSLLSDIEKVYKSSEKDRVYTTFFYNKENNPDVIYVYNSIPVSYTSIKSVSCKKYGVSVLISKINISEYAKNFSYNSYSEIVLKSDSNTFYISKQLSNQAFSSMLDSSIAGTGWKVCGKTIRSASLFQSQTLFKLLIIEALFIIFFLMLILQHIYKTYISKPINQISGFLNDYIILKHTVEIPPQTTYEFDKISQYISYMANRNYTLVHQIFKNQQTIYEKEIENKSFKFYALKSQINPHFLYNTLDCISALAYINDAEPIADITNILSKILRYTITDNPYTVIKDEFSLLENYFSIIKIRYPSTFKYKISTDNGILECKMLHMLMQPIAENSIKHNSLYNRKLTVYTKVYPVNGRVRFVIMDNGVGMSADKIDDLNISLSKPASEYTSTVPKSSHIGIYNINSRIKLMYGNEYGIVVSGKENKYFKITFEIPLEYFGSDDNSD